MLKRIIFSLIILLLVSSAAAAQDFPAFSGQEVVVTGTRFPKAQFESPVSITVITKEDIKASGAKNVSEVLRQVEGVDISGYGYLGGASSIRIRGSVFGQVLVLVDGRRVNSPLLGGTDLNDLLTGNIERIEIVRAPVSALYGADAVGGVINIITKKFEKKNEARLSATAGSFGTQNYLLTAAHAGPALEISVSASHLRSDGFRPNSSYNAQDYSICIKTKAWRRGRIVFDFGSYDGTKGIPGSLTFTSSRAAQTDRNRFFVFTYKIPNPQEGDLIFRLLQTQANQNYQDPDWGTNSNYLSWTSLIEAQKDFILGPAYFVTQVEWRQDRGNSSDSGIHDTYNIAALGEGDFKINPQLFFNLGTRIDKHSAYGTYGSPRVGFVIHPQPDITLRTQWGQSFRAPTLNDLYTIPYSFWGTTYRGNANLKPEIGQTFDIEIKRQMDPFTIGSVTWHTSQIRNMIRWETTGTTCQPENVAAANIQGVEFSLEKGWGKFFKSFINFTYQKGLNTSSGKELTYTPNEKYNVGLRYQDEEEISSNIVARYAGQRFTDKNNTTTLPAYMVVDLKIWKNIGAWEISGAIENLFDQSYQEINDYPMPGRRYFVGFEYNLIPEEV